MTVRYFNFCILVPRGRAPFGQHQEITTSGQVQHRKSTIHGLSVTLRMLRVKSDKSDWFWFQSIVFTKPFKNRMSLDQARGRDFLVLTKRSAASGDENVNLARRNTSSYSCLSRFTGTLKINLRWLATVNSIFDISTA